MIKPDFISNRFTSIFLFSLLLFFSPVLLAKDKLVEDVLKYTNQFRHSKRLPALVMREDLNEIAQKHSEDMAKGRTGFGHAGFNQRAAKVRKIFNSYNTVGENVVFGANNGEEAVSMWKRSSGHRKNLLGNYKYIGIGAARSKQGIIYFTQIFVN